jgi:hypothetical protein
MSNEQDTNAKAQADASESLKDGAPNEISSTPAQDALSDSSLDKVSGGGWPYATMRTAQVSPTI